MRRSLWIVAITMLLAAVALAAQPRGKQQTVTIQNLQFSPSTLRISVGDTVVWTNKDDRDHTVTADDGTFNSGNLSSKKTYSYRFSKAGTYSYSCSYHPRMKGTITVE